MTIWLFHSGMVLRIAVWILSTSILSLFWIRRICGVVWMATVFAQLQVVDLFFKAVYRVLEIPHYLGAHGVALGRRFGVELR